MRFFLTILEGESPEEAEPILATEDARLIEMVGSWITRRLDPQIDEQSDQSQDDARLGGIKLRFFRRCWSECDYGPGVGAVIVCDACGKDIQNAGMGAVVYRKPPYEFDEYLEPFFVHKRSCHRQLETRFGSNLVPWAELEEFFRQLHHNTTPRESEAK